MTDGRLGPTDELERRLREGDPQALAELFSLERDRLWHMVCFRLAEPLRARLGPDDVLQEAFLDASRRLGHYRDCPGLSPFVWLRMVVNQTLVDLHRRHLGALRRDAGREVAIQGNPLTQATSESVAIQLVGAFTSPSQATARAEMLGLVEQAIEQMDFMDREVLAAEFMERLRRGEHPSISEYTARYPDLAEDIRGLFPTIVATERLKGSRERPSNGSVSLGAASLERLGDFRIIREIGRGGMSVVFEAEQESLGRRVAVKVLPRQALLEPKHLRRFHREARIAANLHHTNIVEVFGVGEQAGFHYYVMQYIHGVGLDRVISHLAKVAGPDRTDRPPEAALSAKTTGPDSEILEAAVRQLLGDEEVSPSRRYAWPHYWQGVARIGLQAADALHYAHTQGTLHCDIKPANLLLDASGVVWLTDFGLAKATRSEEVSLAGDMVGTLRYMAPERFRGQADLRSDIYSLGLTLYELLTLEPAYEDTDPSRLIRRITHEPPPAPSASNPQIPRDLETIILKAIAQDADHRYLSAGALADDLRCFLEDRPIQARRVGPLERLGRWCRRNKAVAGLAGTTLFLLILVAVIASVGYVRTKTALQGEADQRDKAEANAALAVEAIDRIFERFSPSHIVIRPPLTMEGVEGETIEIPSPPVLSKETVALLEEMLPFYDRLARQTGDAEEQLRERTAEAKFRVAAIRQRLGQLDEAVKAYQQAITTFQELGTSSPSSKTFQLRIAGIQNELGRLYQSQRRSVEARIHHKLGSFLRQTDRFSEAEQSLRKATAIQSSLVEQFPNAPY